MENEINRIFTQRLINDRLIDDNHALWSDKDFDEYDEDYFMNVNAYATAPATTPFYYLFIYCNGAVYKHPSQVCGNLPAYPLDAVYEIGADEIDEKTVMVSIVYNIPESEYVWNGDSLSPHCSFKCVLTDEGWKIDDFGTLLSDYHGNYTD